MVQLELFSDHGTLNTGLSRGQRCLQQRRTTDCGPRSSDRMSARCSAGNAASAALTAGARSPCSTQSSRVVAGDGWQGEWALGDAVAASARRLCARK